MPTAEVTRAPRGHPCRYTSFSWLRTGIAECHRVAASHRLPDCHDGATADTSVRDRSFDAVYRVDMSALTAGE
jgi:hypothetical protein